MQRDKDERMSLFLPDFFFDGKENDGYLTSEKIRQRKRSDLMFCCLAGSGGNGGKCGMGMEEGG